MNLKILPQHKIINVEQERLKYRNLLRFAHAGDELKINFYWKMAETHAGKEIYPNSEFETTVEGIRKATEYIEKCRKVFAEIKERIRNDVVEQNSV